VPNVHVVAESSAPADRVLAAARDFSARRADLWRDVYVDHLDVHDSGETWTDVTEGNPWPIGFVWERLRYDWSEPGAVKGRVIESNIFKPGSTWEIHATPLDNGGSRVEIFAERHLRGVKGWLLAPLFLFGLARRDVADYLGRFLTEVEAEGREAKQAQ
jgi:Polyketide cyclase / dehydrase and lipid transport